MIKKKRGKSTEECVFLELLCLKCQPGTKDCISVLQQVKNYKVLDQKQPESENLTSRVKEIRKVPAMGHLSIGYLCRHIRGVVMVSSDHVPRG